MIRRKGLLNILSNFVAVLFNSVGARYASLVRERGAYELSFDNATFGSIKHNYESNSYEKQERRIIYE